MKSPFTNAFMADVKAKLMVTRQDRVKSHIFLEKKVRVKRKFNHFGMI